MTARLRIQTLSRHISVGGCSNSDSSKKAAWCIPINGAVWSRRCTGAVTRSPIHDIAVCQCSISVSAAAAAIATATSLLRPARGPAGPGPRASCRVALRRMQQQANGSAVGARTDRRPTVERAPASRMHSVAGASVSTHSRSRHRADISSATCSSSGRRRVRDDGVGRRADCDDAGKQRRATPDVVDTRRRLGSCQLVERRGTRLSVRR